MNRLISLGHASHVTKSGVSPNANPVVTDFFDGFVNLTVS